MWWLSRRGWFVKSPLIHDAEVSRSLIAQSAGTELCRRLDLRQPAAPYAEHPSGAVQTLQRSSSWPTLSYNRLTPPVEVMGIVSGLGCHHEKLINKAENVEAEMTEEKSGQAFRHRTDGRWHRHAKVGKVALISGGGVRPRAAHCGYVGERDARYRCWRSRLYLPSAECRLSDMRRCDRRACFSS